MSKPVVFKWPLIDFNAICNSQSLDAAGNLLLNGNLKAGTSYIDLGNISRSLSLTSTQNLSAVKFTITGFYGNKPITETISGPNNTTVSTAKYFSKISGIVSNDAFDDLEVGTGIKGETNWYKYNYYATVASLSIQVFVTGSAGDITFSFQSTLDNIIENNDDIAASYGIVVPNAEPTETDPYSFVKIMDGEDAVANNSVKTASINYPISYCNIEIIDQSEDFNGEIILTLLQQGIN